MARKKTNVTTLEVAKRLAPEGKVAVAVEWVDLKMVATEELNLLARRTLLLMLAAANVSEDIHDTHVITKAELRGSHTNFERVRTALLALAGVRFQQTGYLNGVKTTQAFPLMQLIEVQDEEGNDRTVSFEFSKTIANLLQQSRIYGLLDKSAINGMTSAYALRLYEVGAVLCRRDYPTWRGDMDAVRRLLQLPEGAYQNFKDFRRRVLEMAQKEIGKFADFDLVWTEVRKGRTVIALELTFLLKGASRPAPPEAELIEFDLKKLTAPLTGRKKEANQGALDFT